RGARARDRAAGGGELGRQGLDGALLAGRTRAREVHIRHPPSPPLLEHLIAGVENLPAGGGGTVGTGAGGGGGGGGRAHAGPATRRRRGGGWRGSFRLSLDQHVAIAGAETCGLRVDRPALGAAALAHCRTKLRPSFFAR